MLNNFDKPLYCVYIYKDEAGLIRYIGNGSIKRVTSKDRSRVVRELMEQPGFSYEILKDGLTKLEAVTLENEYLAKYLNKKQDGWDLLNVSGPSKPKEISYEYFSKYLEYDETSPSCLKWIVDRASGKDGVILKAKVGDSAGGLDRRSGYYIVRLNKSNYPAHRIVWCLQNKQDLPVTLLIDHINRIRSDNRISNLRATTARTNNINSVRNNKSGVRGVSYDSSQNNYRAFVMDDSGKEIHKRFRPKDYANSLEEAFKAAVAWRKEMELLHYDNHKID